MRLALALCLAVLQHAAPGCGRARRPPADDSDDGSDDGTRENADHTDHADHAILANRELTELLLPLLNNFDSPRHAQRDLLHNKRLVEIMPLAQKSKPRKGSPPLFLLASELPVRKNKFGRYNPKESDDLDDKIVDFNRSPAKKNKKHHKHKHQSKHHQKNSTSEEDIVSEEHKHKKKKKHKHHSKSVVSLEEHNDAEELLKSHKKKKHKHYEDSSSSSEEHSDSDEHKKHKKHKKHYDSDSKSSSEENSDSDEHEKDDKKVDKKPAEDKNISNETKNDKDKYDKKPSENLLSKEDKNDYHQNEHEEETLPEAENHDEPSKEKKDSVENKNDVIKEHSDKPKPLTDESVAEEHKTLEVNRNGDINDSSPEKQAHFTTLNMKRADVIVEEGTSQSDVSSEQVGEEHLPNLSSGDELDKSPESVNVVQQDFELMEKQYPNIIDKVSISDNDDSSNSIDATGIEMNEEYVNTVLDDDVLTKAMESQENHDVSSWLNAKETISVIGSSSEEDLKVSNGHSAADNVSQNDDSNSIELALHDSLSDSDDISPEVSQEFDSFSSEHVSARNFDLISNNVRPSLWDLPIGQPPPDSVDSFIEVLADDDGTKHDATPGQNYGYVYRNANKGDVSESHKTYKLSFRFNK